MDWYLKRPKTKSIVKGIIIIIVANYYVWRASKYSTLFAIFNLHKGCWRGYQPHLLRGN